ncbi:fumarylacetoacetate hydrolase family protein [Parvibaculum sp.]|jgi:5-oxopent-3-ene-1,2,5-tricarboxylate decarboxylase/2-hydroxyhepta-2,4-diene-1,7-dioate isomerase|uniref:fumarylacetoacetate hydrolase family protein n=1 Tax=Parvibaculum sp. TaxID=2024848 RepID=UPI001B2F432B|nr:fumarylacetoacetate hydrolase family protein [Parvibaculum sp.]MBO6667607.1 fumarylacetoacetate hydrolase family protein [Parvibaculum sp.]MBO6693388.1 fumarylacetoacetate hydrolase family protein [Parvibaculum sp.]MBO6714158.1 fumarylacetoacetate hydrolase family protein [Parvibaculum sp.]
MSVLEGPREEWRRILHQGTPVWVRPEEGGKLRLGDGRTVEEANATYLPPCDPTKIICIHLNYDSRRVEFKAPPLVTPTYFQKPLTTLNSHRGFLNRPADCQYLNYEGEIAAIVGKPMRNVAPEDVWDHLAGFAPANDVGAQDFRDTDAGSMLRVKGQDGFCPVGPGIVRGVDIRKESVRTYINGKVVQDGPVSEMTFPIDYIFADLSRHITFLPGDIVLTGTPANSRPMNIGDVVEVEVTGVGRISNTVQEAPAPAHKVGHQPTDSDAVRRVALGQF